MTGLLRTHNNNTSHAGPQPTDLFGGGKMM